jgi:DNA-binding CsgD family transcriptional regulator
MGRFDGTCARVPASAIRRPMPSQQPPPPVHAIRGLMPAFEALARIRPDRLSGLNWLPYATLAGVVLATSALLLAFAFENRQPQRAAALRDVDSGAQRVGARLATISESLSTAAVELGSGKPRFAYLLREMQVLGRIAAGRLNKQIAGDLGISIKTVEAHCANIMSKLRANTVADLMRVVLSAD